MLINFCIAFVLGKVDYLLGSVNKGCERFLLDYYYSEELIADLDWLEAGYDSFDSLDVFLYEGCLGDSCSKKSIDIWSF